MEEDIKLLEDKINFCKNNTECRDELNQCFGCAFEVEEIQAIENLIARYKETKLTDEEKGVVEAYRNLVKITGKDTGWVICDPKQMWSDYFVPKVKVEKVLFDIEDAISFAATARNKKSEIQCEILKNVRKKLIKEFLED